MRYNPNLPETLELEVIETGQEKRGRGRPTKEEQEKRRKAEEQKQRDLLVQKANKTPGSAFPGDRNKQLANKFEDSLVRKDLVKSIMVDSSRVLRLPPCKTVQEVEQRISDYFNICTEEGILPTVEGLALSLGTTRNSINDWESGRHFPERGPIIQQAKEFIALIDAQLVAQGALPAIPYIFRAKNYYGMSDKTEVQITKGESTYNESEIKERLKHTIPIDAEFEEK